MRKTAITVVDFAARAERELTILLYHGVTNTVSADIENYSGKHMHVDEFAKQIRYVKQRCAILSFDDIVSLSQEGKPFPPRSVAVSFDDGFANNYSVAAPVLDACNVPAIFYVSTGVVSTNLMFWVDELEDCLNRSGKPIITVTLDVPRTFHLGTRGQRIASLETIKGYCKRVSTEVQGHILTEVKIATEIEPSVEHAENYRKITWPQLREMAASPLFTIGGHSLYHSILSELPLERMTADIRLSIDLLRYQLRQPIIHYSYPEGQAWHYNAAVIATLKASGIVCCPSAIHGLNPIGTDLFQLKRIMVGMPENPFPFSESAIH